MNHSRFRGRFSLLSITVVFIMISFICAGIPVFFNNCTMEGNDHNSYVGLEPVADQETTTTIATTTTNTDTSSSRRSNRPPILSWTGEENYMTDGVHPQQGVETDHYEYHVSYKDLDNDEPESINVVIDGVEYPMSTRDTVYIDGSIFTYTARSLSRGTHNYYFTADDGKGHEVRFPKSSTMAGPKVNTLPRLITPTGGTVSPPEGVSSTRFTFSIIYLDKDNDPPITREVIINNKPHTMSPVPGAGTYHNGQYFDGELFQYTTQLPIGTHKYQFHFVDDRGGENYTTLTSSSPKVLAGYPDLAITPEDISFKINASDPRDDITISARVRNIGGGNIDKTFYVTFFNGSFWGENAGRAPIGRTSYAISNGVRSGESVTVSTIFSPGAIGSYDIYAVADLDFHDFTEENYHNSTTVAGYPGFVDEIVNFGDQNTNNMARRQLVVGADLSISRQEIQPHSALVNKPIILSAIVRNVGSANVDIDIPINVTFSYKINNGQARIPISTESLLLFDEDRLGPNEKIMVYTTWVPNTVGQYSIYVAADTVNNNTGVVSEVVELADPFGNILNNTNNMASTSMTVSAPAPSVTTSFGPSMMTIFVVLALCVVVCGMDWKGIISRRQHAHCRKQ